MKNLQFQIAAVGLLLVLNTTAWAVIPDGSEANLIIGQQPANAANVEFAHIAVDPVTQKVFVGDENRHRILRFSSADSLQNGATAEAVLGQRDFISVERGTGADRLSSPAGLTVDSQGRLWVADSANNRILRFSNAATIGTGASADGVLGQVNFDNQAQGTSASTLRFPQGVVTDVLGNLYVADTANYRVLRFNSAAALPNGASASVVLGQPDFVTALFGTHDATHLNYPTGVAISPNPVFVTQPYLWVADLYNHRVVRYNDAPHAITGATITRVLGQPDFTSSSQNLTANGMYYPDSLAADSSGRLYVGSSAASRVQRFDNVAAKANNAPADGILGQAAFTTNSAGSGPGGVDYVNSITLGANGRLWIADRYNHRVLRHEAAHTKVNGADADGVLGAPTTTTDLTRKFSSEGIAIDPISGKLFVSDYRRNRVLRFASVETLASGGGAEAVFGQPDFTGKDPATAANRMRVPSAITVDSFGNLWVVDEDNHRVLRFNNAANRISGTAADGVLGQPDFTTSASSVRSASTLNGVLSVVAGSAGELWASDGTRVLRFDNARLKGNGAPADGVLGQGSFTSNISGVVDAYHFGARGLALDPTGRLWVADYSHYRILRFDHANTKPAGAAADGVLGQSDFFTDNNGDTSPDGVFYATLLAEPGGRLWVTDRTNNRILRWENAAARANGADADGVLGQPDFGFEASGEGLGQFYYPDALARDAAGNLWISDRDNERIVRYSPRAPRLSIAPINPSTVALTLEEHARGVDYDLQSSLDLQHWISRSAFTAATNNPIGFAMPIAPGGHEFYRVAEVETPLASFARKEWQ